MTIALWIAQALAAAAFLYSGIAKSFMSKERLIAVGQTGIAPFPIPFIRVIAWLEIAGVLGLILPQATGIAVLLTPVAAVGLAVIMIGAAFAHGSLREFAQIFGVNLVLFLLCAFIAIGRFAGW
jgi:uncharacterized membrane protein YphA (DoxX/SURF4 family)